MIEISPLVTITLQFLAAILCLNYLRKSKIIFVIVLTLVLCLTLGVEVLGLYYISIKKSSHSLYFLYFFFVFNLIGLGYSSVIKLKEKYILLLLPVILNLFFIMIYIFKRSFFDMMIIGSLSTSFYAFLYLKQLLLSEEIVNYKKLLPFWVSVGFLVFYLPSIPFFSLISYLQNRKLYFITKILTILMNIFIIYGLLCSSKEEKY